MEFKGIIKKVLELRQGVSQQGKEWQCAEYLIEEQGNRFNQSVAFQVFGKEKIDNFDLKEGDDVTVYLDLSVNEYNGRYYNKVNCYNVSRDEPQPVQQSVFQMAQSPAPAVPVRPAPDAGIGNQDEEPF